MAGVQHLLRKAAIEKMSSPEQLDMAMRVTSPMSWLALATLGALVFCAIVYSVVGAIPVRIDGNGILIRGEGTPSIEVTANGTIQSIEVEVGDLVERGQVVAHLDLPQVISDIERTKQLVAQLESQQGQNSASIANMMRAYEAQLRSKEEQKRQKQKLLAQGLARQQDVAAIQGQIDSIRAQMYQSQSQQGSQTVQLDEQRRTLSQLEEQYQNNAVIRARTRGRVAAVLKTPGQVIGAGESLINLEEPDAPFRVLLFVPFAEGKKIVPGKPVRLSPSTVKSEEYGFMLGRVESVSSQPVTFEEVKARLNNDLLAQKFARDTPFLVRVVPETDEQGRFQWTSGEGPPSEVAANTGLSAQVIVDEKRPISYVIPTVKKTLGLSG